MEKKTAAELVITWKWPVNKYKCFWIPTYRRKYDWPVPKEFGGEERTLCRRRSQKEGAHEKKCYAEPGSGQAPFEYSLYGLKIKFLTQLLGDSWRAVQPWIHSEISLITKDCNQCIGAKLVNLLDPNASPYIMHTTTKGPVDLLSWLNWDYKIFGKAITYSPSIAQDPTAMTAVTNVLEFHRPNFCANKATSIRAGTPSPFIRDTW